MKAVVISKHGDPDVLQVEEIDPPVPGPGDLLVDVAAAGINFMDVYQRLGRPPYAGELPVVPGSEGAGVVVASGAQVEGFSVGDHVAWTDAPRSYASQVTVPSARAVRVPDGIDLRVAAAVMLQGMTAHYLCNNTYPVKPGDTVVVHAAAGGVGNLLVQLVKRLGGSVIATTSSDEKAVLAREAGADIVVSYDTMVETAKRETSGVGANAVYDGVGAATFESSLAALRPHGFLVLFGAASGPVPPFDLARLAPAGSLYVTRPTLRHYIAGRDELIWRSGELFAAIEDGSLTVRIGGIYPLDAVVRSHEDLEARRTAGKLLLIP